MAGDANPRLAGLVSGQPWPRAVGGASRNGWVPPPPTVAGGGWVPPPVVASTEPGRWSSDDADPVADVGVGPDPGSGGAGAAGLRDRALASALAAYTAAHGHPLEAEALTTGSTRWATPVRMAAVGCAALVLLSGIVVARTLARAPSGEVVVEDTSPFVVDEAVPVSEVVVVHVAGQVVEPGVVELANGSRVADAISAAGGAGPDADLAALNLARVLVDGEQVLVPRPGETSVAAPAPVADGRIDVNRADAVELQQLPGIGEVLAGRIVEWRDRNGPFTAVDDLIQVSGIGPSVLESVRDLVTVG